MDMLDHNMKYQAQRIIHPDIRGSQQKISNSAVIAYPRVQRYDLTCDTTKSRFAMSGTHVLTYEHVLIYEIYYYNDVIGTMEIKFWRHVIQQGKIPSMLQFIVKPTARK